MHAYPVTSKKNLVCQKEMLELYCAAQGWTYEVITDLGSGMNYQKRGLKKLLDGILERIEGLKDALDVAGT